MFCDIVLHSVWWKSTFDNGDEDDDGNDVIDNDNDYDDENDNAYENEDSNQIDNRWIVMMMILQP